MHLLFAYHWISKVDNDQWKRLSKHLGTVWDRSTLEMLNSSGSGTRGTPSERLFIPLSLSMNPDLPEALLGKKKSTGPAPPGGSSSQAGDGLRTEMALPAGEEVVNMGDLPKNEFIGLVSQAGLASHK
jgi:hypothetical protein